MVKILWIVGISLLAGLFGRLGGAHGYNTKFRDLGVPLCWVVSLLVLGVDCPWWAFLLAFGAVFCSMTTYWDTLFHFDNLWFSGFITGIASFPIALFTGHWITFGIRVVILALIWGALNKYLPEMVHRDVVEEFCRYAVVVGSAFLLV